jgi:hypothetical protein
MQIFESWAHHMSEEQFVLFAKAIVRRGLFLYESI